MAAEQVASWRWNHISNTWEKVPAVVTTQMLGGIGVVKAAPGKLYWIACNPSAGLSNWALSDDLTGLTATVLECFSTARETKGFSFTPPMNFATGIYLKTFTNMTAITFGYI